MNNREIKFRAWVYDSNTMVSWEEMVLNQEQGHCFVTDYFNGENELPMQFTGLKDKNGKEIYEGDVVHLDVTFDNTLLPFPNDDDPAETHHEGTFKVYWNTENACFDLTKITGTQDGWFLQESKSELEVIGNIFENPELLK